ncbi:MAG: prepilin-type N-terminal cleavage/methylation domain-containing protein [Planctomycetota bacterium]|nr:MAG: prepilin-type N-terminal cleavage/methylation domain-containing protein [Planctomycetota bacterium]
MKRQMKMIGQIENHKTFSKPPKGKDGFSLIEILIAAAILAAGLVAFLAAIADSSTFVSKTSNRTLALQALETALEHLRAKADTDFGNLYQDFSQWNPNNPFTVEQNANVVFMTPDAYVAAFPSREPPLGQGYFEFVTNETTDVYMGTDLPFEERFGTAIAFNSQGGTPNPPPYLVDITGDGAVTANAVIWGRTVDSPTSGDYFIFMPVYITIEVYSAFVPNGGSTIDFQVSGGIILTNGYSQ